MIRIGNYILAHPWWLLLLLVIPFFIWLKYNSNNKGTALIYTKISSYNDNPSIKVLIKKNLFWMNLLALSLLIIAMARPQKDNDNNIREQYVEGIDIAITLDASQSMLQRDYNPNRLEAAKNVIKKFIENRQHDRIALVVFESQSYTQCALTNDKENLLKKIKNIRSGLAGGSTSIGLGLTTAVNRLKNSDAKNKIIILLSDGRDAGSSIHPIDAAHIAKEHNIRIYTIGMVSNHILSDFDEPTLKEIAKLSDGKYFRATNINTLENIYNEIDQIEKSKLKTIKYDIDLPEAFHQFVLISLIIFAIAFITDKFLLPSST